MLNKVIFIGQAAARSNVGGRAFDESTASGKRLMSLAGSESILQHEFVNLLEYYPGREDTCHPKGDAFPMDEARTAADRLTPSLIGRRIVMVGDNVARAFGVTKYPWCIWMASDAFPETEFAVLPHPSGVNMWYNDRDNLKRAKKFLRGLCCSK